MEKLGGLPIGLPDSDWPVCKDCGRSQSLLAQFQHDGERLDLGRAGRILFVFQCNHDPGMCATWEAFSGANACLVIEPEMLSAVAPSYPADEPSVENCALVSGWLEREDGLTDDEADQFYSDAELLQLGEETIRKATMSTRLGGVPSWIQGADEAPKPDWRFLGQLDSTYSFLRPPTTAVPWIQPDPEAYEGRTHWAQGPNFGDGGIAYLFTRRDNGLPNVVMFWQCG